MTVLFGADQRHGHAAGTAAAPGELGGGHLQHLDAVVAQDGVGHVVALVDDDLAGGDAQGVGAVVPLLPGGGDQIVASAVDQLHVLRAGIQLQDVLQVGVYPFDGQLLRGVAGGDLIHRQRSDDGRMDGVLVHVDLGKHGVQVHESPAGGDLEGQDGADLHLRIGKQVPGRLLDGVRSGALGDADGQRILRQVQHVAALDAGEGGAVIVPLDQAREVRMIAEDVVGVDRLPAAGGEAHLIEQDPRSHGREGIPGEIQVGHGIHHQIVRGRDHVLQGARGDVAHLPHGDALHGLLHQGLPLEVLQQVVADLILPLLRADVALLHPLVQKGLRHLRVQLQHLGHQVLQIDHLGAVVPQDPGEGVVLLPGHLQERDVVEQQLGEPVGDQVQQFPARPVQEYFLQGLDLISDANTSHRRLLIRRSSLWSLRGKYGRLHSLLYDIIPFFI